MEAVVHRDNLRSALKRVKANDGSPGVDGMTTEQLSDHLRTHWPSIREQLLSMRYQPQPVKWCEIPKATGGTRVLGIPTALDRFIQQAVLQVLQPRFDPTFSAHSYGFRPGRNAHQAIDAARQYVAEGRHVVVDVDLKAFFDRIHHDVLMGRLARRIEDKRVLKLIRAYLGAGILAHGVVMERHQGAPQGGPLSPLLANVMLDEVDKDLEARGHRFVRYADDCNVYVRSVKAGERVMESLRKKYASLHLEINESKSAVAAVWGRKFLGYSFFRDAEGVVKKGVSASAQTTFRERVKSLTCRTQGRSLDQVIKVLNLYLVGWKGYFGKTQQKRLLHDLDGYVRRRLRMLRLRQWSRSSTIYRELRKLGMRIPTAWSISGSCGGWWPKSLKLAAALPPKWFDSLGLKRLRG